MINIINKILRVNEINIYTYLSNYKKVVEKFNNEIQTIKMNDAVFTQILYKINLFENKAMEEISYIYDYGKILIMINKINVNLEYANNRLNTLTNQKSILFVYKSIDGLNKALDILNQYIKTA